MHLVRGEMKCREEASMIRTHVCGPDEESHEGDVLCELLSHAARRETETRLPKFARGQVFMRDTYGAFAALKGHSALLKGEKATMGVTNKTSKNRLLPPLPGTTAAILEDWI